MENIALADAKRLADEIGAMPLEVEGYRQIVELHGRMAERWLFAYRIACDLEIPVEERLLFAGAAGCLVSDDGSVRELNVPSFIELEGHFSDA